MECECGYEEGENPNCTYCKQFAEGETINTGSNENKKEVD